MSAQNKASALPRTIHRLRCSGLDRKLPQTLSGYNSCLLTMQVFFSSFWKVMDALFVTGMLVQSVKQVCAVVSWLLVDCLAVKFQGTVLELAIIVNSAGDKKPTIKIPINQPSILLQCLH